MAPLVWAGSSQVFKYSHQLFVFFEFLVETGIKISCSCLRLCQKEVPPPEKRQADILNFGNSHFCAKNFFGESGRGKYVQNPCPCIFGMVYTKYFTEMYFSPKEKNKMAEKRTTGLYYSIIFGIIRSTSCFIPAFVYVCCILMSMYSTWSLCCLAGKHEVKLHLISDNSAVVFLLHAHVHFHKHLADESISSCPTYLPRVKAIWE